MAHDDAGANTFVSLKLRHVKAHDVVELFHTQRRCSFIGSTLFQRTTGFAGQSVQLYRGVLASECSEVFEVAALRCSHFHSTSSPFIKPRLKPIEERNG
jgi:hypothetical protein